MNKATCNKVWLAAIAFIFAVLMAGSSIVNVHAAEPEQTDVKIDAQNFPDEAFRNYVIQEFDSNKDDLLSAAEIAAAKTVNLADNDSVESVRGIELLPALTEIDVSGTAISGIDVTKNPELKKLNASMCYTSDEDYNMDYLLTSIDVTKNPKLEYLDITYSKIDKLDVSKNPNLEELHAFVTNLSEVDVTQNPKLRRLDLNTTDIREIDVTKNPKLFALNLEYTEVSSLDVTKNPELYEVYLTGDKGIKELNTAKNPDLTHLRVSGTGIHSLDLSKNHSLAAFYNCRQEYENPITLDTVVYEAAPIEELDFSHTTNIFEIFLEGSPIKSIDVSNQPNLRHLQIQSTPITKVDVSKNPKLGSLCVSNTKIKHLDISKNKKLATLDITNTDIDNMKNIDLTGYTEIYSVKAQNADVESLKFDKAPSLSRLELDGNHIKELDLEGRSNPDTYNTLDIGEQTPEIYVSSGKLASNTVSLKDLFSNPANVTVKAGEGYTYDADAQTITFKDENSRTFKYEYATKFESDGGPQLSGTATVVPATKIASVKPAKASYTYTGKTIRPGVTVKGQDGKVLSSDNYTVSYSKSIYPGKYTVKAIGKNKYDGTVSATYKIYPKSSAIKKLKKGKKKMTVSWTKQSKSAVSGYQIKYSKSKKFSKRSTKIVTVKTYKTSSKTIKKLKARKKYYVRVRTYKTVKGSKYYSSWSKTKSVKVK
ncbi:MAG: fibronectin type III domain-containing protein [Mogibacterium sp.]|uniref:leucine-rich repeat domain-containing protein n=1 Tax=Mogibacterium sp. TaxID=2049035 RepID=UPI001A42236D|nr:fibronectin type III domain-containing protein [Mogibacterium sp.]MBL6468896.1 fibronectin type III domain-containing protein [Mogibacterium sp.]